MGVMAVNHPSALAEVTEAFRAYEHALVAGDVESLQEAFWASELTVRYGLDDRQYGREAIDTWRRSAPPVPAGRKLGPTVIATFGETTACVSTEFRDAVAGVVGRQSQTWVRVDGAWRIVAAHVSRQAA